ncbi:probable serine carboxypeptidase CPVL isoform X2 [Paramacrobiotus metropolitanus]|uniref:probable serine carboxypeptidase CPVL isoform X2 n=1 Tax=Paramacrobiotus metropolitanus TaxID=2943436 RepID=UPI002445DC04|nr:probable serine carboxypeptidase CPVL isoform X2 [Paramacrobiotus metropolitanus]
MSARGFLLLYFSCACVPLLLASISPNSDTIPNVATKDRTLPKHIGGEDVEKPAENPRPPSKLHFHGKDTKTPKLPKHLLGTSSESEEKPHTVHKRSILPQHIVEKLYKGRPQEGQTKLLTDRPFWKPWKPHQFGQLTAKDCPAGDPLILTPLIRNGNISEAQQLARVRLPGTDIVSYSGYFTVNQSDSSNLFFWFFPAEVAVPEDAPVLLWLQGGPGATSMFGLFDEHGPWSLTADFQLKPRDYRWSLLANVIYIDNPVGTGFSFTKTDAGYARNEDQVGKNLYEALLQFYEMFPQYQQGSLYVSGESYAGKYVPALGYTIHVNNPKAPLKLPFKGIALGNGFVDPENMLDFGDLLYSLGMADINEAEYLRNETLLIQAAIRAGNFREAFNIEDPLVDGDIWKYPTYFYNITGSRFYYNFLLSADPEGLAYYWQYVNQCYVRKALHVGNQIFDGGVKVEQFLLEDIFQTAKNYLVPLLENYRVLIYNGQLDIICALPFTEKYLELLDWKGAADYKKSTKYIWKVEDSDVEPAGYVRHSGEFYQVAVRRAGHMVPYDQPRFAFDMIYRFLYGQTFHN